MNLIESTEADIPKLTDWIAADPYHRDCLDPIWWLTGNGLLSYRVEDSSGTTMYVRLDKEGELMRIHTQFAPESEVSRSRVAKSILWSLPNMTHFAKQHGLIGYIFKSTSPELIEFMGKKFGFTPNGNDDYSKLFEESINVRTE